MACQKNVELPPQDLLESPRIDLGINLRNKLMIDLSPTARYPTGDRMRRYVMSVRARPEVVIIQKQMKEQGQRKEQLRQVVEAGADAVLIFGGAVLVQGLLG